MMKKSLSTTLGIVVGFIIAHIISSWYGGLTFEQMFNAYQIKRLLTIAMVVFILFFFYNRYKDKQAAENAS